MITTILQLSGGILLAKGLLIRKEFDLFLNIFSFMIDTNSKKNGRIKMFYEETYISLFGGMLLILGYALPMSKWDINLENFWCNIGITLFAAMILIMISIKIASFAAKRKAGNVSLEYLLRKYDGKANDMGLLVVGVNAEKENDEADNE
ncbi:hypothetical protein MOE86_11605 [Bacillus atrophaeus]|uniref:hypothetical protein n=1 Tax=Bacillus atrophaeus TaxID=1452 RepID=UPI002281A9EB|nr:hypothetical protein [Bacillus atrophaeus]MCY9197349.1 hypothetical protein [Bacillus atrophaeus]